MSPKAGPAGGGTSSDDLRHQPHRRDHGPGSAAPPRPVHGQHAEITAVSPAGTGHRRCDRRPRRGDQRDKRRRPLQLRSTAAPSVTGRRARKKAQPPAAQRSRSPAPTSPARPRSSSAGRRQLFTVNCATRSRPPRPAGAAPSTSPSPPPAGPARPARPTASPTSPRRRHGSPQRGPDRRRHDVTITGTNLTARPRSASARPPPADFTVNSATPDHRGRPRRLRHRRRRSRPPGGTSATSAARPVHLRGAAERIDHGAG